MTLLFVLGPAVCIYLFGTRIARKLVPHKFAACAQPEKMGPRFFIGAILFGVGWGLVGACPGPALVILAQGSVPVFALFASLLIGIAVSDRVLAKF